MTIGPQPPACLRVMRGRPTEEEVAAVSVVLLAVACHATAAAVAWGPTAAARSAGGSRVGWSPARDYRTPGAWTAR